MRVYMKVSSVFYHCLIGEGGPCENDLKGFPNCNECDYYKDWKSKGCPKLKRSG